MIYRYHSSPLSLSCASFAGAISLFAAQKVLQKRLPYPLQWNLLVSIGGKWMIGFKLRHRRTWFCLSGFSDPACLFTPSGIIGGKLCRDSLGNTEMLRPLAVSRNRKSPRQIAATGWVWLCGCRFACCSLKFTCLFMCFSVQARGIKRTWEDKIWRRYGISILKIFCIYSEIVRVHFFSHFLHYIIFIAFILQCTA